jgi:Protein of unknown function (DUF559)
MEKYNRNLGCMECGNMIDVRVFNYSLDNYQHPLCRKCQDWLKDILEYSTATDYAIDLYFALKDRGVPAQLEKSDGFKTIDMAVPHAKVNIEVDGMHHSYNGKPAMSDLRRTLYSFKKGYSTLRIPNTLAEFDLEETADLITDFLNVSRNQKRKRYYK